MSGPAQNIHNIYDPLWEHDACGIGAVVDIQGKERVTGVTIAQVDEKSKPIPGTEEHIPCDTLLLSVGLLPENELSQQAGVRLDAVTGGPERELGDQHPWGVRLRQRAPRPRPGGLRLRGGPAGGQARRGLCPRARRRPRAGKSP